MSPDYVEGNNKDSIQPLNTSYESDYLDSPERLHQRLLIVESKLCDLYRLIEMLKESNRTIWEHTIQCWDMKHEHPEYTNNKTTAVRASTSTETTVQETLTILDEAITACDKALKDIKQEETQ